MDLERNLQTEDRVEEEYVDNDNQEVGSENEDKEYDEIWNKDVSYEDLVKFNQENSEAVDEHQEENSDRDESDDSNVEEGFERDARNDGGNQKDGLITLTRPLKYRGKEFYPQTEEELIELAQKGLDYSFKMNKIKPYRELINFLEQNGIEPSEAIKMLQNNNFGSDRTSAFDDDIFADSKDEIKNEFVIDEGHILYPFVNELKKIDKRLPEMVIKTYDGIEPTFKVEIASKNLLKQFVNSVVNGEFERVYPVAKQIKQANPFMSWVDAYVTASKKVVNKPVRNVEPTTGSEIPNRKPKPKKQKPKSLEEQYNEIWENSKLNSVEELEKILIEGV